MSEYKYNYRDNSFNTQMAYAYTLLVQVGTQSFDYAVLYENRVIVCEKNCAIGRLANARYDDVLSAPFQKAIVGISEQGFTLIPSAVFRQEMAPNLARFLDVKPQERVLVQPLDAENYIVYKTTDQVLDVVSKAFNVSSTVFASKGLIIADSKNTPSSLEVYANLKLDEDKLEIIYFKGGKLHFYNSFVVKHPDEVPYFIGVVCTELKLDPSTVKVIVSGDVASGDGYFGRLSEFFRTELSTLAPVELPAELAAQQLLPLTSLVLCA